MVPLAIFIGGGSGALCRWLLALAGRRWLPGTLPSGTLAANCLGCFLMGLLGAMAFRQVAESGWLRPPIYTGLTTGFLGGLTTFSTFSYESIRLGEIGGGWMLLNVGLNVIGALAAAGLGIWIAAR